MSDMSFKHRRGRRVVGFVLIVFGLSLLVPARAAVQVDRNARMIPVLAYGNDVQDNLDWVKSIIQALAEMAPNPTSMPTPQASSKKIDRASREQSYREFMLKHAWRKSAFVGKRLLLHKSTVWGHFNLMVQETGPCSFNLLIVSMAPAENVLVEDRISRVVLVRRDLEDKTAFTVRVPHALDAGISVAVSVLQDGGIEKAYFPLLGSDFVH